MAPTRTVHRKRSHDGGLLDEDDVVAVEEPLEVRIGGRSVVVLLRTPGRDEDLAVGFCLTEGLIREGPDVDEVRPCAATPAAAAGNVVDVVLRDGVTADLTRHQAPRFSNSACGVCGIATLENLVLHTPPLDDDRTAALSEIIQAPDLLLAQQPTFRATGGLHAAGLIDDDGALHCVREDVGRHNATDKAIGAWALEHAGRRARALVVSSRAGFEILQKAHAVRIPIVVSVGAPTSLAVDTAERAGITLCAFATRGGCSVYTHAARIRG